MVLSHINCMDSYKPCQNSHQQVYYAQAQQLGLHGLHNVASTIAHSHCLAVAKQDKTHIQGTRRKS